MADIYRKTFLVVLKFIPFILALCYFIGTILPLLGVSFYPGWIWGISLISFLFILAASYLFKFCFYHRIFLYYAFGVELLNNIKFWIGITSNSMIIVVLILLSFFIVCTIALINYLKHNEQVRIFKDCPTKYHQ